MKRFVSMLMCLCLALAVLPALAADVSEVMRVTNCKEWVSLRERPDAASRRLEKVSLGELVTHCAAASGDFIRCEYNGKTGYIQSKYLTKADTGAEPQPAAVQPAEETGADGLSMIVVNCDSWVSLRQKASASSKRLAKVPLGAQVDDCSQAAGGFIRCSYNGVYGYIQTQYLSESEANEPEAEAESDINPNANPTGFNALPVLPERESFMQVGETLFSESYQDYTIVAQRLNGEFEEMLAVCYDPHDKPLWRLYAQSLNPVSDVQQLDAFVAGTLEDPQLIWYISGLGFYSYSYGPAVQLRWYLPDSEGPAINGSIIHAEDYNGNVYVAFSDVLMLISPEGKLVWRTSCDDPSIFWPISIEISEDGISVLYDNLFGVNNMYTEAQFSFEGVLRRTTQRAITQEA